jgi:hypothetical protein
MGADVKVLGNLKTVSKNTNFPAIAKRIIIISKKIARYAPKCYKKRC